MVCGKSRRKCILILPSVVVYSAGASWGTPFGRMGLAGLVVFLIILLTLFAWDSAGASRDTPFGRIGLPSVAVYSAGASWGTPFGRMGLTMFVGDSLRSWFF